MALTTKLKHLNSAIHQAMKVPSFIKDLFNVGLLYHSIKILLLIVNLTFLQKLPRVNSLSIGVMNFISLYDCYKN